jgi:hypothetical protein
MKGLLACAGFSEKKFHFAPQFPVTHALLIQEFRAFFVRVFERFVK